MCGILGVYGKSGKIGENQFSSALDLLRHRGPDGSGLYCDDNIKLGHRRLAIIGTSSVAHQPFQQRGSDYVLCFNGEIYNYLELGNELISLGYSISLKSDTEVLYWALHHWGTDALNRLNGMWAFAFYNKKNGSLLLSRDRFGVKPLYYINSEDFLAFASEPKALLDLFPSYRQVNENTLLHFLCDNQMMADGASFYSGIQILPASNYALLSQPKDDIEPRKYWDYPETEATKQTRCGLIGAHNEIFDRAVKYRLRSDVPVGLTLSGGIDSTSVLVAANQMLEDPITSFTSTYKDSGFDERNWAKIACASSKSELVEVETDVNDFVSKMRRVVWHMDSPNFSPAVYPLFDLYGVISNKGIKVVLEGQGADEALAGYPQYHANHLIQELKRLQWLFNPRPVVRTLRLMVATFGIVASLLWVLREGFPHLISIFRSRRGVEFCLNENTRKQWKRQRRKKLQKFSSALERMQYDHKQAILPALLHYGDAISMAKSVEARNPFLDYELVEFLYEQGSKIIFGDAVTKPALRGYLSNNGQHEIAKRMDKVGYMTPTRKWMKDGAFINHLLLSKHTRLSKWLDQDKIRELIKNNKKDKFSAEHNLYKLVSAEIWLRECIL